MSTASNNEVSKNQSTFKLLNRLAKLNGKYIYWYIALVIAALAMSALSIADTEGIRRIVNGATQKNTSLLRNGVILCFMVLVIEQTIDFIRGYAGEILDFVSIRNVQVGLLSKLTKILMKNYDGYHTGDLIDRLNTSTSQIQTGVNRTVVNILQNIVTAIFLIIYLGIINIQLTVASIIFAAVLPFLVAPISKKLRVLNEQSQKINADKSAFIQDVLQGSEVVKVYMLYDKVASSLDSIFNKIIGITKKLIPYESLMNVVHMLVIILGDFFVLGYGGLLVSKGVMGVGDVIAFVLLFERMFGPISYIATVWPTFQASLVAAERVLEIYDLPEEHETKVSIEVPKKGDIVFKNVSFSYKEDKPILSNISFTAQKGQVTAIVGPSGSGKSTILKLLMGLYTPASGEITYGSDNSTNMNSTEFNISDFKKEHWRKKFSYISQEPNLFSGTLKENILYGRQSMSMIDMDNDMDSAAQGANIADLISKLEDGFNTVIGERGTKLSGGERQRLSIARSVFADAEILVMDEPTSSLDNENERTVMSALDTLMKDRTTIVVAHRLSTIKNADKILFLNNGVIKETGTHYELMSIKGSYYKMYEEAAV